MKKFSLLSESKESVYDIIGIDKEEIFDICEDLIDDQWDIDIKESYLSKTGKVYLKSGLASEYYPMIIIILKKEVNNKTKSDVRHWDGGIFFSNNLNDIKSIYLAIERIKNLTSRVDNTNLYWAFRGPNEIYIRITLNSEKSDNPVTYERVDKVIQNLKNNKMEFESQPPMKNYKISSTWSGSSGRWIFDIIPAATNLLYSGIPGGIASDFSERAEKDFRRYLYGLGYEFNNTEISNVFDFPDILNHLLSYIKTKLVTDEVKLDWCDADDFLDTNNSILYIHWKDTPVLRINAEKVHMGDFKYLSKKGFLRNTYNNIEIYKIEITLSYDYLK
jgi:hypothetical protein